MKTIRGASALVGFALVAACASEPGTGPSNGETTDLTLTICPDLFDWVAYRNDGGGWQQITSSGGEVTVQATEKLSLAFSLTVLGSRLTQVINASAEELQGVSLLPCLDDLSGDRVINGSVVENLFEGWQVIITGVASFAIADADMPAWSLEGLPNAGTVDVVASPQGLDENDLPDRVIIRRAVVPNPNGTPIAPLDFESEAATPVRNNVSFGFIQDASLEASAGFTTATRTTHSLSFLSTEADIIIAPPGSTVGYLFQSLPASLRLPTDVHFLTTNATTPEASFDVLHFYTTPADKRLDFGPMVSAPTVSQLGTSPYLRLRAQVPSQTAFPNAISADFYQSSGLLQLKIVSVMTTEGYAGGTPGTWDVEIPDFGSSGYQADWGLSSAAYQWDVTGYAGDIGILVGTPPADGATLTSTTRFSSVAAMQPARALDAGRSWRREYSKLRVGLIRQRVER